MTSELVALSGDREIGRVRAARSGKLSFVYDEKWRHARESHPMSLSMPLAQYEHPHDIVSAYLWGLLPDNEVIIERWARRFQVSAHNPFALIAKVGEDCAGAVRFVDPERFATSRKELDEIEWLDESAIAERLRALAHDVSAWRRMTDVGQFSLAGAQSKIALLLDGGAWGIPSGRIPTTHILKPGIVGLDGHAENEHLCLSVAHELGLPTASSEIRRFEEQVAIVIQRYDRARVAGQYVRVHQEDVCQALGIPPSKKYENEGGPGVRAVVALLREHSTARDEDVETFVSALAFNWLIGGTDGHAKNYSMLISVGGRARLAPIYDVASALPYDELAQQKLKLAMKIGGKYRLRDVGVHEWSKLCAELRLETEAVLSRVATMADMLPEIAREQAQRCRASGLAHPLLDRLVRELRTRAATQAALLRRRARR